MTPDDTIDQVARLLSAVEGTTVISATHSDTNHRSYIRLSIVSLQSLARIVHHCNVGANVALDILAGGERLREGQALDEKRIIYQIEVPDDDGRGSFDDPPAPLHILGVFLARDLKYLGLLPPDEADALQKVWHGVVK